MIKKTAGRKALLMTTALLVFGTALLLTGCGYGARTRETWVAELLVTGKESVTREGNKEGEGKVYLIRGEDADGESQTFELTDEALAGKFEASQAFYEIKMDKYYKFGVGWHDKKTEGQEGYYPSIYYTVALKGFSPEEGEETQDVDTETQVDKAETEETQAKETEAAETQTKDTDASETQSEESEKAEVKETETGEVETSEEETAEKPTTETESAEIKEADTARENAEDIRESIEAELTERFRTERESIEASLEESYQAERESMEEEINRLRESAEGRR